MVRAFRLEAAFLFAAAALAWLQFSTPYLVDRDSYYHARYAQLMPQQGLSRQFPWAQESVWKDHFADKELLFHAWLAPFCREGREVAGAKWATFLLGCGVIGAIVLILVGNGGRFAWVWVLLIPALGNHFLFRMMPARSHVLSLLLLLLGIHFLLKGRWRWLGAIGFLYSWSYTAPHLLVGFAIIDALARGAIDRRFEWRGLAWSAGGVLAGLVINPYFPNDLSIWWIVNVQIIGQAWGLGGDVGLTLGEEFQPILPRSLIVASTLVMICFLGTFLAATLRRGSLSRRSQLLAAYMVGGFLLYAMSARFIEYFAPLALLAAASVVGDLWPETPWTWRRVSAACVAGVLAIGLCVMSLRDAHGAVTSYPGPDLDGAAAWTRSHVPPGETIVHVDWGDFVQLYYFDPTHHYLVGLDPTFMYVKSKKSMQLVQDLREGRKSLDPVELAKTFGSRYLVVRSGRRWIPENSGLEPVYQNDGGAVYKLVD